MGFFDRLEARVRQVGLLCVGIDPHPGDVLAVAGLRAWCMRLVEATAPVAAAFKPNAAFFEAYGADGVAVLREVIRAVPDQIPVILDVKRGDIASTAEAYAQAAYEALGADAVTVSPYLGPDAVEPFVRDPEHAAFVLCRTSNRGAAPVQEATLAGGELLYEHVARSAASWSRHPNVGLVVGATEVDALRRVRQVAPGAWILAPGVGAQGGDLGRALDAGLRDDGLGMLIPVSRALGRAANPRAAAEALRDAIATHRAVRPAEPAVPEALARGLIDAGCVRFGAFTLKSGLVSPMYIDLRRLAGFPSLMRLVADAYVSLMRRLSFDCVAALPYAALPIGTAVCLHGGWPLIYPRREAKGYGTGADVEGVFEAGQTAVVLDDLATTGLSKLQAVSRLEEAGLRVSDMVVLIDRESGAREALAKSGFTMHAVLRFSDLLTFWEQRGLVAPEQVTAAREFIARTSL
ncbi:MAG: hypothetical protein AMXMBFR64_20410 [Myxococcales bacterium]